MYARVVGVLLALVLTASACSGSDSQAATEPAPFDAVLIELFGTDDTEAYVTSAERVAAEFVVECMSAAGFEYKIPPLRPELDPPDPESVEDARTMGFGIVAEFRHRIGQADVETDLSGDPNLAYLSTLTAEEIERFLVTLDGPEAEPGQRKQDAGCNGEASDVAYGDWVAFSQTLANYTAIGEERDTHPDWLAARSVWRECMIDRGYDYADPDLIRSTVISRMQDTIAEFYPDGQLPLVVGPQGGFTIDPDVDLLLDELALFEQSAAVANVECTDPIADRLDAVEHLVQQDFVDRNREAIDSLLDRST